jgi:hypothetical protein
MQQEENKTLHEIKKQRQTEKWKKAKLINIQKAIAGKKKKFEERQK